MKQYWQREAEALRKIGWVGTEGLPDRERAVSVVIELMGYAELAKYRKAVAEIRALRRWDAGDESSPMCPCSYGDWVNVDDVTAIIDELEDKP